MGRRITAAIATRTDVALAGTVDRDPASWETVDARAVDAVVEFTHASAIVGLASRLQALGKPWLSGTTGLGPEERQALVHAAGHITVLWAANLSLGIALLRQWLAQAAALLPPGWECEIVETHHSGKRDAPSGTALLLAEAYREVRGGEVVGGRGPEARPRAEGEIGLHAVRLPGVVGEHRVVLANGVETITLQHQAHDRDAFALGALEAVRWLVGRPAGLYGPEDWARDRLGS